MAFEADLYTWLNTLTGLTALVGDRIYPGLLPENGTLPAVVYSWLDKDHDVVDPDTADANLSNGQLRFSIHAALVDENGIPADAYAAAHAVATQLRLALNGTKRATLAGISAVSVTELHTRDAGYDDFTVTYVVEVTAGMHFTESAS